MTTLNDKILKMGGKAWQGHGHDRVYITCDILNALREEQGSFSVNYGERNNKIFLDVETGVIMRSYKGGKPTVELELG